MEYPDFYPDGLTPAVIDALIAEVDAELADAAEPTSALLTGTDAERRRRRNERRVISRVVRALPIVTANDQEAA